MRGERGEGRASTIGIEKTIHDTDTSMVKVKRDKTHEEVYLVCSACPNGHNDFTYTRRATHKNECG